MAAAHAPAGFIPCTAAVFPQTEHVVRTHPCGLCTTGLNSPQRESVREGAKEELAKRKNKREGLSKDAQRRLAALGARVGQGGGRRLLAAWVRCAAGAALQTSLATNVSTHDAVLPTSPPFFLLISSRPCPCPRPGAGAAGHQAGVAGAAARSVCAGGAERQRPRIGALLSRHPQPAGAQARLHHRGGDGVRRCCGLEARKT